MCTLTWLAEERGYRVFFNRDERRTRKLALAPRLAVRAGVQFLAPIDAESGGTWIAVNEHGLTLALLNGYRHMRDPSAPPPQGAVSRGLLVSESIDCTSARDVEARVRARDLARFQPFLLLAFEPGLAPRLCEWDGRALGVRELTDRDRPMCSSSSDPAGADRARAELFAQWRAESRELDAALLERFHASHLPERGALSPCMHRADAETVSFTHIAVGEQAIELHYRPGAPCQGAPWASLALVRRRAPVGSSLDA